MKALLLSEIFPPKTGGSGRWFWEIYRRMPLDRLVIAAGEDGRQEAFDATHDLPIHRVPLTLSQWGLRSVRGLKGYWRALHALRPIIRQERVTVVHCGRCLPEGVMALALKWWCGLPYWCYIHGEEVNTASTSREFSWLVRRVLNGAHGIVANSRNTEQLLLREWGLPPEKIHLLHPGVDTKRFVPSAANPGVQDRFGWTNRRVVLTVGRLQKRKGHDMLIRALAEIKAAVPNVFYAIAGDGEERSELVQLTAQLSLSKHVQFLGEISDADLIAAYQQCDLFVLPNRQVGKDIEGFGMVLLEAQSCGKPVIAGDSGGTAETMQIPTTGKVVNCDRPTELAAMISELLLDEPLREKMGTAARRWAVDMFDWESLCRQAEELFGFAVRDEPEAASTALIAS